MSEFLPKTPRAPKPPMDTQVKAALITAGATILAAVIAGAVALYTAGDKTNKAAGRPATVIDNLRAGLVLANPSRPASDSFQSVAKAEPAPIPTPAAVPVVKPQVEDKPAAELKAGTCSGLDKETWSVQLAPVTPLKGKDGKGVELTGYNVNLRLTNSGARVLDVNYNQADLTDDAGNQINVSSSSLPLNNPNFAPIEVGPGDDLPVNMRFLGPGGAGKSVSFNINLHIFTKRDDLPHFEKVETLACVNQPVS